MIFDYFYWNLPFIIVVITWTILRAPPANTESNLEKFRPDSIFILLIKNSENQFAIKKRHPQNITTKTNKIIISIA